MNINQVKYILLVQSISKLLETKSFKKSEKVWDNEAIVKQWVQTFLDKESTEGLFDINGKVSQMKWFESSGVSALIFHFFSQKAPRDDYFDEHQLLNSCIGLGVNESEKPSVILELETRYQRSNLSTVAYEPTFFLPPWFLSLNQTDAIINQKHALLEFLKEVCQLQKTDSITHVLDLWTLAGQVLAIGYKNLAVSTVLVQHMDQTCMVYQFDDLGRVIFKNRYHKFWQADASASVSYKMVAQFIQKENEANAEPVIDYHLPEKWISNTDYLTRFAEDLSRWYAIQERLIEMNINKPIPLDDKPTGWQYSYEKNCQSQTHAKSKYHLDFNEYVCTTVQQYHKAPSPEQLERSSKAISEQSPPVMIQEETYFYGISSYLIPEFLQYLMPYTQKEGLMLVQRFVNNYKEKVFACAFNHKNGPLTVMQLITDEWKLNVFSPRNLLDHCSFEDRFEPKREVLLDDYIQLIDQDKIKTPFELLLELNNQKYTQLWVADQLESSQVASTLFKQWVAKFGISHVFNDFSVDLIDFNQGISIDFNENKELYRVLLEYLALHQKQQESKSQSGAANKNKAKIQIKSSSAL